MISLEQFNMWLTEPEGENLEFKEKKYSFDFEELVKYCAALANEGGGHIVYGVSDKQPRQVVGTQAVDDLNRTKSGIMERIPLRIEAGELQHADGRIVVFEIPARPLGMPIQYKGAYWMRRGENLVAMTPDKLQRIFAESGPDFSAEICAKTGVNDLDPEAIRDFRARWRKKSGNSALDAMDDSQLLADAELVTEDGVTYAALILFGTRKALGRYLSNAEVIFEYRSTDAGVEYQQRQEYRQGFFLFHDVLWKQIDLRNDVQHFQDGLFKWDIPTLNESVVREALLNAICHRDYRDAGSIFVRQYPKHIEITNPGGFPEGVTPENILDRSKPRNRRVAEALGRCGLVERSGQGMDLMMRESIREAKRPPDFAGSDERQVCVRLDGEVRDTRFLLFLEKVGAERQASFDTRDFLILDLLHRDKPVPDALAPRLDRLRELKVIESAGRKKFILSRELHGYLGKKGVYTRKKGLDQGENMALLLKHIRENARDGSPLDDLMQVLPSLTRTQVQNLLRKMRKAGEIHCVGRTRAGRWYLGLEPGLDNN